MNKNINLILRNELPQDYKKTEEMTREAFWNHFCSACDEHYLLHIIRDSDSFINELDIVAELNGEIVGNIIYTKAQILTDEDVSHEVLLIGPLAVSPQYQGKGIGGKLIKYTISLAADMGFTAIFLYGDPDYYSRFGFIAAEKFNIGSADNMYVDALQVFELSDEALSGISGRLFEDSIFELDGHAVKEFDKDFPKKELAEGTPSQQKFLDIVKRRKPRL